MVDDATKVTERMHMPFVRTSAAQTDKAAHANYMFQTSTVPSPSTTIRTPRSNLPLRSALTPSLWLVGDAGTILWGVHVASWPPQISARTSIGDGIVVAAGARQYLRRDHGDVHLAVSAAKDPTHASHCRQAHVRAVQLARRAGFNVMDSPTLMSWVGSTLVHAFVVGCDGDGRQHFAWIEDAVPTVHLPLLPGLVRIAPGPHKDRLSRAMR
jgi:hypothetical protein